MELVSTKRQGVTKQVKRLQGRLGPGKSKATVKDKRIKCAVGQSAQQHWSQSPTNDYFGVVQLMLISDVQGQVLIEVYIDFNHSVQNCSGSVGFCFKLEHRLYYHALDYILWIQAAL